LLKTALWVLKKLNLTQYGPEQLDFLRYRPVLLNTRLKEVFGYTPKLTSAQVFDLYRNARQGDSAKNGVDATLKHGQVILITGAAGGLGAALCGRFRGSRRTHRRDGS
jgi:hypothetical protein